MTMEGLAKAVESQDIEQITGTLFDVGPDGEPIVRQGYRRETDLWDFKVYLPPTRAGSELEWAEIASDLMAFHNARGGILVFGIDDKRYSFVGASTMIDAKRFNEKIRRYLGDKIWVDFAREFPQADQRYLGIAVVRPRGLIPLRLQADAPADNSGKRLFSAGDLCVREGDQTRIYRGGDAEKYLRSQRLPSSDSRYLVRDASVRILRPDWDEFVARDELCEAVMTALRDKRTYVTTLSGVGGVGKTALACWAVLNAYNAKQFEYIVSVSAKDRELTDRGIEPLEPSLSSFEDLLGQILEVLGFSEYSGTDVQEKEAVVRELLADVPALLFLDNLETLEDKRIIPFVESLPKPVKAITTSRLASIRRAAYPVPVGQLSLAEAIRFFDYAAGRKGRPDLKGASNVEKERIVAGCSRVPLVIQWLIGNAPNPQAALALSDRLSGSGEQEEQLLEFCFRRVHSGLPKEAQLALSALALGDRPQLLEGVSAATDLAMERADTALGDLEGASLAERVWDEKMHDFAFRILPITRRFAYRELVRQAGEEDRMRKRLGGWYEGKDVQNPDQRRLMVAIRTGQREPDAALVDAAILLRTQGKVEEADKYFRRAIDRNPGSWRAHREYAELLRDQDAIGAAIGEYEIAAAHAPKRGNDRALIFRELGMLLRRSGRPKAFEEAVENFEIARSETPNDTLLLHALAGCHVKCGHYRTAIPILEKLVKESSAETRSRSYDLLAKCYAEMGEKLKHTELLDQKKGDEGAQRAERTSKRSVATSSRPLVPTSRKKR